MRLLNRLFKRAGVSVFVTVLLPTRTTFTAFETAFTAWTTPAIPAPLTVTVKLLVPVRLAASVPVQVTMWVPTVKDVPEAGLQTTLIGVAQPLPAGVVKLITMLETPAFGTLVVMLAAEATVGFPLVTTTAKLLVPVRLAASVTVQLTVVVPTVNDVPEAGVQTTVPGVLQPEAVGSV